MNTYKANRIGKRIGVASLAAFMLAGGSLAYFSGTADVKKNAFSIAEGEQNAKDAAMIEEFGWDTLAKTDTDKDGIPDQTDEMQPGHDFLKDPQIQNKSSYSGWAFLKVVVPEIQAKSAITDADYSWQDAVVIGDGVAKDDGTFETAPTGTKYTSFGADALKTVENGVLGDGWKLMGTFEEGSTDGTTYQAVSDADTARRHVYIYGYKTALAQYTGTENTATPTPTSLTDTSTKLFQSLQVPDFAAVKGTATDGGDNVSKVAYGSIDISGALLQQEDVTNIDAAYAKLLGDGSFKETVQATTDGKTAAQSFSETDGKVKFTNHYNDGDNGASTVNDTKDHLTTTDENIK